MMLEHVPWPQITVEQVARVLKPGGLFVFSVPDAGAWEFGAFGRHWYALDCPRHLTHFDQRGLTALLRNHRLSPVKWKSQRNVSYILGSLGLLFGCG